MYVFLSILMALVVLAAVLWLDWYLAGQFYAAVVAKGYEDKKYFWLCFLLGAIGYLLVVAMPDRGNVPATAADELPDL